MLLLMTRVTTGSDELGKILKRAEDQLWVDFEQSGAFKHHGNQGTGRELALIRFLNERLPGRFRAANGEIVDVGGERSGQIDILLYDRVGTAPLLTQPDGRVLIGAEAVLAVIEVKSTLSKSELQKAINGFVKVRSLRPWGYPWARYRPRGKQADKGPRCFSSIFAFDTDLGKVDWALKELTRVRSESVSAGFHPEHLDRIVVLSRGLLLPADGLSASSKLDRQVLGMWYSALLHFVTREADRRAPFPWHDYESWDSREWDQTLPGSFTAPEPATYSRTQIGKYKAGVRPIPRNQAKPSKTPALPGGEGVPLPTRKQLPNRAR
jgi:hypothetical protein